MKNHSADDASLTTPDAQGLSAAQAAQRLREEGRNELPASGPHHLLALVGEVVLEPMFLLLLAAVSIYVVLGDIREALVLGSSVFIIVIITVLQERRTEHALARLRDLSSPRAVVIRDGRELRIAGVEVVRDDVIRLGEGDRVPADAVLISTSALTVDESILTGESLPVSKHTTSDTPGAENTVYSGSLVVSGHATARVIAIGANTAIGHIGRSLSSLQTETTPLFLAVRRMVRWLAVVGVLLCVLVAVLFTLLRGQWVDGVLAGITLAMGVLPEEFPVVLTVFMAIGAWRISRHGVLTRRMPAIESLGAATVLAVDKTGTLTENRMQVVVLDAGDQIADLRDGAASLNDATRALLVVAQAASEQDAFDPMEQAIHIAALRHAKAETERRQQYELVKEFDLTPALLAVTHVWQRADTAACHVAVKGAPEAVIALCQLPAAEHQQLMQQVTRYADQGLRVLAVAAGEHQGELPDSPQGFRLQFRGLLCLADPLRTTVPAALQECRQAGIRVVMITGDHPGTALAIARQAGFDVSAGVMTGSELASLPDDVLRERIRSVTLFARTLPEQKLRLVQLLKANGDVVAMTGDGVNDAPALKAAHVGVAMGTRGTDVAREAASLVLLHDDFDSLVTAVRLGRRIYDNIRHAMNYLLAVHIPVAGMGLLPILFGWPLLLFPVHVLFMEFIIDPACSFIFEADEASEDILHRKPRAASESLFSARNVLRNVLLGLAMLLFSAVVYGIGLSRLSEDQARALAFAAMVTGNLLLILLNRNQQGPVFANRLFWWISSAALLALSVVLFVPAAAALFHFSTPPFAGIALMLLTLVLLGSGLKLLQRHQ